METENILHFSLQSWQVLYTTKYTTKYYIIHYPVHLILFLYELSKSFN